MKCTLFALVTIPFFLSAAQAQDAGTLLPSYPGPPPAADNNRVTTDRGKATALRRIEAEFFLHGLTSNVMEGARGAMNQSGHSQPDGRIHLLVADISAGGVLRKVTYLDSGKSYAEALLNALHNSPRLRDGVIYATETPAPDITQFVIATWENSEMVLKMDNFTREAIDRVLAVENAQKALEAARETRPLQELVKVVVVPRDPEPDQSSARRQEEETREQAGRTRRENEAALQRQREKDEKEQSDRQRRESEQRREQEARQRFNDEQNSLYNRYRSSPGSSGPAIPPRR